MADFATGRGNMLVFSFVGFSEDGKSEAVELFEATDLNGVLVNVPHFLRLHKSALTVEVIQGGVVMAKLTREEVGDRPIIS